MTETGESIAGIIEKSISPTNYELTAGNKKLVITIFGIEPLRAGIKIETIDGERRKGLTTALYNRARQLMEQTATRLGQSIEYTFATTDPSMKKWALDPNKGMKIFGWTLKDSFNDGHLLKMTTTINPQPPQPTLL